MPDCFNHLTLIGRESDVQHFLTQAGVVDAAGESLSDPRALSEYPGFFRTFLPIPENVAHGMGIGKLWRKPDGPWVLAHKVMEAGYPDIKPGLEYKERLLETKAQLLADGYSEHDLEFVIKVDGTYLSKDEAREQGIIPWLEWSLETWGCKWDVHPADHDWKLVRGRSHAGISFSTAWCPPTAFVRHLQKTFPQLYISLTFHAENAPTLGFIDVNGRFFDSPEELMSASRRDTCHGDDDLVGEGAANA